MRVRRGVSLYGLHYHWRLSWSIHHSALLGQTVARRYVADARAVALNLVIQEFVETGGSIARHPHEFGRERGRRRHPSELTAMAWRAQKSWSSGAEDR